MMKGKDMRDIDIVPGYSYSGKHIPTGETWWIIGIDLVGDRVCAAGWPPSIGKLSDMQDIAVEKPLTDDEINHRNKHFGYNWL